MEGVKNGSKIIVAQRTLRDVRDSKNYTIRKLADGNCWMTSNLRLVGPKNLTQADSQVSSAGFSLTGSNPNTWCISSNATCVNQSLVLDSNNDNYGMYYNWYAATAGTGTYPMDSGAATNSICPKGWELPSGGPSSDFVELFNRYSYALRQSPVSFAISGHRYEDILYQQGENGWYWSKTVSTSEFAHTLYVMGSGGGVVDNRNYKYCGMSVRCIAERNT